MIGRALRRCAVTRVENCGPEGVEEDCPGSQRCVGYLIAWRNPTVRLKDGTTSKGKRILIGGQQRVTALMAALLGHEVTTKDYETVTIRIAFHPGDERFEVTNPAIAKDPAWLPDVAVVFHPDTSIMDLTEAYAERNPAADRRNVARVLERLRKIIYNHVGIIDLAEDLDIETVTEIFIRVNSAYSPYDQVEAKEYPAILVTTGLHDSPVQYFEPAKWVAKLRAMKTDDNLLILKTNMEAGHGGKTGRFKRQRDTAFEYAFLLDQAGIHN